MTWNALETVELLQGMATREMTRKMEEEHIGKVILFEKMIEDFLSMC